LFHLNVGYAGSFLSVVHAMREDIPIPAEHQFPCRYSAITPLNQYRSPFLYAGEFIKTARKPQPFKAGDEWQPGAKPEFHLA
jgi:hypothetical protein